MAEEKMPSAELGAADLYAEYCDPLERYALRLTRDVHQTDDLVQDTMMRAMLHLPLLARLNPHQRKAWLCRVLRNRFFDAQRAQKRAQTMLLQVAKQAARTTTDGLPVDMQDLLECVPDRYRDVLEKRYALGMTSSEIGRTLGIPAATVRSRLHAAIKWLRVHRHELTERSL